MPEAEPHLVVGRLRRPHGLKGEIAVFPLTDDPAAVLAAGRTVRAVDLEAQPVSEPLRIERSRQYHREWLVKFAGADSREALEPWRGLFLGVPASQLQPPSGDEVYLHELEGFAVADSSGQPLGVVSGAYELPAGLMIEVQGPKREFLLPYKKEFVVAVDRDARRLTVAPPPGLLDD